MNSEASGAIRMPVLAAARPGWLIMLLITALALALIFFSALSSMVQRWSEADYSHAWLIPPIAAFLVWQRRDALLGRSFSGSWWGLALVLFGLLLWLAGELSSLYTLIQYAFLVTLAGVTLACIGGPAFRLLAVPLLLLLFMIPLPNFIYLNLSQQLQLLSSQIGVWVIRHFGISVFLEGNVIDLGNYQLQVVEACSGLRYLFPLMTLGFMVALFFRAPLWQRLLLFVSTAPITVLMNSFRIGVIGVLVDRYGSAQAEGFLHDFEGWVIFMTCFVLLFAEMWLLTRLSGSKRTFRQIFAMDLPPRLPKGQSLVPRPVPWQAWAAAALLAAAIVPALSLPERVEVAPSRAEFSEFPLQLAAWNGRREQMEAMYVDTLKFSDYILADYIRDNRDGVNFYAAYYESQRKGQSAHSPKGCLPGGGWVIEAFDRRVLSRVSVNGSPLPVNRVLITHGGNKQLVYYWFQQRGRLITNEYLVKWYLLWDALTRNRSDGSLVRLITPIAPTGSEQRADEVLQEFARNVAPLLARYIPN